MQPYGIPLLQVVAGSIGTGVSTPESDRDYLGVFAAPTDDILTFGAKVSTSVLKDGDDDVTWWEVRHAFDILLRGNFNALPILYSDHVLHDTEWGVLIRENRDAFISVRFIKSMLGYSKDQLRRWEDGRKLRNASPEKAMACVYRELVIAMKLCTDLPNFSLKLEERQRQSFLDIKEGREDLADAASYLSKIYRTVEYLLKESDLVREPDYDRVRQLLLDIRESVPHNIEGSGSWDDIVGVKT